MNQKTEGYELTPDDCAGLAQIRSTTAAMAEFAAKVSGPQTASEFNNRVKWLDDFMDRIGATAMLRESLAFHVPTVGAE